MTDEAKAKIREALEANLEDLERGLNGDKGLATLTREALALLASEDKPSVPRQTIPIDPRFADFAYRLWVAGGLVSNRLSIVSEALDGIMSEIERPLSATIASEDKPQAEASEELDVNPLDAIRGTSEEAGERFWDRQEPPARPAPRDDTALREALEGEIVYRCAICHYVPKCNSSEACAHVSKLRALLAHEAPKD